jgi:ATP-dependent helicase HrpA
VRRRYRDAHWSERQGHVYAYERVLLDGLVLEPRRRVHYGPIHPKRAREVFLRHALVHGRYRSRAPWWRHNEEVLAQARLWQARLRRSDLVLDAEDRFAFYDARVPADVHGATSFERWRAEAERQDPRILFLDLEHVLGEAPPREAGPWPDRLLADGVPLPLGYRLAPAEDDDGITVRVPLAHLGRLRAERLDWLVPGWLAARIEALLRTLPKTLRRALVPLPDTARDLAARLAFGEGSLLAALVLALAERTGRRLRVRDFVPDQVPPHLQLRIEVLDEAGQPLVAGRDLAAVLARVRALRGAVLEAADAEGPAEEGRTWVFGTLPERVQVDHGGFTLAATPALIDRGDRVRLAHVDAGPRAARLHRRGVRRLLLLEAGTGLASRLERHPRRAALARLQATRGPERQLHREILDLVVDRAAGLEAALPRDAGRHAACLAAVRREGPRVLEEVIRLVEAILAAYDRVARKLMLEAPAGYEAPLQDMVRQLARLVEDDVFVATPWSWLQHVPRYLAGIDARLLKIGYGELERDHRLQARLDPHLERWREAERLAAEHGTEDDGLVTLRWLLEEYRIALFAQELGTSVRVSEARLDEAYGQLRV